MAGDEVQLPSGSETGFAQPVFREEPKYFPLELQNSEAGAGKFVYSEVAEGKVQVLLQEGDQLVPQMTIIYNPQKTVFKDAKELQQFIGRTFDTAKQQEKLGLESAPAGTQSPLSEGHKIKILQKLEGQAPEVYVSKAAEILAEEAASSPSSSVALSTEKVSQKVDVGHAAHILGMTDDAHQAVLTTLLHTVPLERGAKLETLREDLDRAGLEGHLITTQKGTHKIVLMKKDPLGTGMFKNCHAGIKLSGKAIGVCKKAVMYKAKAPATEVSAQYFQYDVNQSQQYSEILKDMEGVLRYKKVTYTSESGEQQTVLMAQLADGGELKKSLGTLNPDQQSQYMREFLNQASILEERGLIHRDFKTENLLLVNGHLVVADLGLMTDRKAVEHMTGIAGTPAYAPPQPEESELQNWTFNQDAFAAGLVLLEIASQGRFKPEELLVGDLPFQNPAVLAALRDSLELLPDNRLAKIISGLTHEDYAKRLTLTEAQKLLENISPEELKRCNEALAEVL